MKAGWERFMASMLAALCATVLARMMPFFLQLQAHKASEAATTTEHSIAQLPVFFFHGLTDNARASRNYVTNFMAEGRKLIALNFCENECSKTPLLPQIALAIAQIRNVIAADPETFKNGYIFMGHSQGGVLSRAVIELMDDHDVKVYISLAGVQNGVFYGPQSDDVLPLREFTSGFCAEVLPRSVFDTDTYASDDRRGKLQFDLNEVMLSDTNGQALYAFFNHFRSPQHDRWVKENVFLPMINSVNDCDHEDVSCKAAQQKRRRNFLRLKAAHFFVSPQDNVISPWQTAIFGRYQEIDSSSSVAKEFDRLKIVDMKDTTEYTQDTFGLKTLDERGSLVLHVLPDLHHSCWIKDFPGREDMQPCVFQTLYEEHIYPVLH